MTANRYTLLFDGNCRICSGQAELVARYDSAGRIQPLDMNTPEARASFPQVTPAAARRELHLVAPDGALYRGPEAVRQTLLRLPRLRALGRLMGLPGAMAVARPLYRLVARNRYLLGGRAGACDGDSCRL
jgi:predicted DCC family thiol-disulfide oxidoreductase YuxK